MRELDREIKALRGKLAEAKRAAQMTGTVDDGAELRGLAERLIMGEAAPAEREKMWAAPGAASGVRHQRRSLAQAAA
jgi:hypothetical protein